LFLFIKAEKKRKMTMAKNATFKRIYTKKKKRKEEKTKY